MKKSTKPKVIDLFCGAGGLSLGAYRAGFDVVRGIDRDKQALATHLANFPSCDAIEADLATLALEQVRPTARTRHLSGIIGGPPCQGFSSMGKRDIADTRNSLFIRFFECIEHIAPDFFMAENVPGILNDRNKSLVSDALDKVSDDYYVLDPLTLNASDFGAATSRKRVFFIGFRKKVSNDDFIRQLTAHKVKKSVCVKHALRGVSSPTKKSNGSLPELSTWGKVSWARQPKDFAHRLRRSIPLGVGNKEALKRLRQDGLSSGFQPTRHTDEVIGRFSKLAYGEIDLVSKAPRLDPESFCPVLRAGTGPDHGSFTAMRPIHPWEPRVITPREAARLQGFPDWFLLHDTTWHSFRHIGNSVSPILAEKVLATIHKFL